MTEEMNKRLQELRAELDAGQKLMADLTARETNLRSSMLRISGAIQVLEELLAQEQAQEQGAVALESPALQPVTAT